MNPHDDEDNLDEGDDPENSVNRSERKRKREKQRRFDLANAFTELGSLLSMIEPEESDADASRKKGRRKCVGEVNEAEVGDASGMPRLDLIGRTIETLRRIHQENLELKHALEQKSNVGDDNKVGSLAFSFLLWIRSPFSGGNNFFNLLQEVLVMVPTLTSTDDLRGPPPPSSSGPYPYYHTPNQPPPVPPHMSPSQHHDYGSHSVPYYSAPPPPGYHYGQQSGWNSLQPSQGNREVLQFAPPHQQQYSGQPVGAPGSRRGGLAGKSPNA
ncbi:predicted protein [Phaeodactylum tricornutum CCAP 1055/1]|uniref:BHLH domain-containing protein n=1 Tax=Phaeodactylum tricornutum (strain CCAP 1055/1) TaxID=556484 RepID=B7FRQ5_PHATC|nr:predicted protein [Phaeodactylum tricornutum CCAP 1055/1]EEC51549.1 predicted protein [Phaeodactylum tricornutum CCAP 1055/1]|eukprot:XP_002177086.1 predicted protein [Phaeodactylum tricornutum CCAP 1055/1]